jgi:hypothetical protein
VSENQIDPHLAAWQEYEPYGWRSLLLGNGFSINIWERFAYTSLFNVATSGDVDPVLDATMFEKLGTSNFEDVLRALYHARIVDEQLNSPQRNEIEAIYSRTKNSLAAAVNFAHVPHGIAALISINNAFRSFCRIYTTNYDLLPYWAIMHTDVWRFKDLFWGENNTFDPKDTSVWAAAGFMDTLLRCEDETGGGLWEREGNLAGNSRLKQSSWSRSAV